MIYRHLRQLERDGFVSSEWNTDGTGPAKRMYHITPEGDEMLAIWIEYMKQQSQSLIDFIELYRETFGETRPPGET